MKPERRTLTGALMTPQITPEAYALIKEGTPKPQTPAIVVAAPEKPQETATDKPVREPAIESARPRTQKEREPEVVSFTPMTVRVPSKIPAALLKAASERKLQKNKPYTQQDIVAEALQVWLQKHGYMPEKG
jgi:hypothetical protein